MSYFYYSSLCFFFLVTAAALFLTRAHWLQRVPGIPLPGAGYLYSALPSSSSFAGDVEAGLSSASFDLVGNLDAGDPRAGLDDAAKAEVLKIMKKRRMTFDQARKVYIENRFRANGIGADGTPRDPKFVSFS